MRMYQSILAGIAMASVGTMAVAGESTPAEKEQTRQLNIEAMTYAKGVPAAQALPESVAPRFIDYGAVVQPTAPSLDSTPSIATSSNTVSSIAHPPSVMANANVVSSDGMTVGLVQKILLDPTGKPFSVDVALKQAGKTVSFDADDLSYNAIDNIVIASRSSEQIMLMPGMSPQG